MVATIYSGIHVASPDVGLTLHEVRAIMNLMVIRVTQGSFRKFSIHPVSPSIDTATPASVTPNVSLFRSWLSLT